MARVARLGVVIDASGAKRGAQETNTALQSIDQTAKRTVSELKKAAGALGVAFGIRGLQQAVDQYTLLDARLRQVTRSSGDFARVQTELFRVAQDSRSSYAATIDLYTRLARSSDQLGISQTQLLSVTEAVSNAVRLSNASTSVAEAGIVQLGQAFASGTLRGDELRSIMEQLPQVANAIADGLGVPIGKLREMGEAGELSGRKVALALDSQRERLALLAGEIPTTIGQALQQLNNAFGLVVAGSDEAKSATAGIAGVLGETARFMVEYRDAVVAVSVALGVGGLTLAAGKAGAALMGTAGAAAIANFASLIPVVGSLTEALALARHGATLLWSAMTGPIGLTIAGLTAVAAAVYLWRTRQKEAEEAIKASTKSAQELYDEAKRLAGVTWVSSGTLTQLQNLGGELRAAQQGGKASVEAFRAAAQQWKDTSDQTRSFAQALAEGDQKAKTLLTTTQAQVAIAAQVEAALSRQTKAQQDAAKATEERARIERDYQAQVVQLGIELTTRATAAETARIAALRDGARATATILVTGQQRIAALREEVQALAQGGDAARVYAQQQAVRAIVTERLNAAAAAGVALSPQVIAAIVAEARETQRLIEVRDALKSVDLKDVTNLPAAQTIAWTDSLRDLLGVVQLVSQAFGDVGRSIAQAATGAQSIGSGLQRAGQIRNAQGQAVGLGDALRGQAGASGVLAGIGSVGAVVGGFSQIIGAIAAFGSRAEEQAEVLRQRAAAFNAGLSEFAIVSRTSEEQALRENLKRAQAVLDTRFQGTTLTSADQLESFLALLREGGGQVLPVYKQLADLLATIRGNEAVIRERTQAELRARTEDLEVRRLVAAGLQEAADAERMRLQQLREIADAEAQFGASSPYLDTLREVQAAETAAAEATRARLAAEQAAEQARTRTAFGLDLTQRRQLLAGDDRGAFQTGQTIAANAALAEAQQLVEAGTITAAMFEELRVLLGQEMVQALADFDAAVARAKQATLDDLAVRFLAATGQDALAEQARIEIENRRELEGVTDETIRQQIQYVQSLEAVARETAKAAAEQSKIAEQSADIDRRMLDVLRALDPAKAAELEAKIRETERAKELAGAANEMIRLRLDELYAMEDAARAQAALTAEMEKAARAAENLARLTASVEEDYLRAMGRTFEADLQRLREQREARLREAREAGASQDVLDKIIATFEARIAALIADQMAPTVAPPSIGISPTPRESITTFGESAITAVRGAQNITEGSAMQLVDYAASQLAVQREILGVLRGRSATPELAPSPSLDVIDRQGGRRATTAALLLGGTVR